MADFAAAAAKSFSFKTSPSALSLLHRRPAHISLPSSFSVSRLAGTHHTRSSATLKVRAPKRDRQSGLSEAASFWASLLCNARLRHLKNSNRSHRNVRSPSQLVLILSRETTVPSRLIPLKQERHRRREILRHQKNLMAAPPAPWSYWLHLDWKSCRTPSCHSSLDVRRKNLRRRRNPQMPRWRRAVRGHRRKEDGRIVIGHELRYLDELCGDRRVC